jgi:hypothetical protein
VEKEQVGDGLNQYDGEARQLPHSHIQLGFFSRIRSPRLPIAFLFIFTPLMESLYLDFVLRLLQCC